MFDESCDHGAGYVYGLDVRDAAFTVIRDKDLTVADIDSVVDVLRSAIQNCHDLRDADSVPCANMLVKSIPEDLVSRLPDPRRL